MSVNLSDGILHVPIPRGMLIISGLIVAFCLTGYILRSIVNISRAKRTLLQPERKDIRLLSFSKNCLKRSLAPGISRTKIIPAHSSGNSTILSFIAKHHNSPISLQPKSQASLLLKPYVLIQYTTTSP